MVTKTELKFLCNLVKKPKCDRTPNMCKECLLRGWNYLHRFGKVVKGKNLVLGPCKERSKALIREIIHDRVT